MAPMSLVTYEETRPWAKSIRQRVITRQMPPWHIDYIYADDAAPVFPKGTMIHVISDEDYNAWAAQHKKNAAAR